MNKIRISIISLVLFIATASLSMAQDTLRVLAIGNSFSQDAVEQNLYEIAAEDGKVFVIGNMYIGGCSLERHINNALTDKRDYDYRKIVSGVKREFKRTTLDEALRDEKWDVVSLQQVSGKSGMPASYEPYLEDLVNYVKSYVPDARLVWHQTWAYAEASVHPDFNYYDNDREKMYACIVNASRLACEKYGFGIIPCGTAIQNLRGTDDGENCTRDGYHLNHSVGRYTAALTWYAALTGRSILGISYRPAILSERRASLARKAAQAAVESPYATSDLELRSRPVGDQMGIPVLPDLTAEIKDADGKVISPKLRSIRAWDSSRRPSIIKSLTEKNFGTAAERGEVKAEIISVDDNALGGTATCKQIRVLYNEKGNRYLTLLLYTPNSVDKAPVFLGLNRDGNETVTADTKVLRADRNELSRYGVHRTGTRGEAAGEWQLEELIARGYGLATFCADDAAPDFDNSGVLGLKPLFDKKLTWGCYAQWAWALSKAMDYLVSDEDVDASRVALVGSGKHSVSALWAGATDERFALVGAVGMQSWRDMVPEQIQHRFITPAVYCKAQCSSCISSGLVVPEAEYKLFSLIAPRALYVSAYDNAAWLGTNVTEAARVYRLWGPKTPAKIKFSKKESKDTGAEDWNALMDFADRWMPAPRK